MSINNYRTKRLTRKPAMALLFRSESNNHSLIISFYLFKKNYDKNIRGNYLYKTRRFRTIKIIK